ncbi:hypothetical protein B0T16DRAFT_429522 [Cercophora newfieldiana]|uniref:Uncharacterized protein n=1 Tax=Cercophora newfieldiana TaxID=92897 RepID=A0AA39Y653_9PEZI|nr:hypothetical protein B0T16DRAFT_429522 [Cercophora newfieldiana]
MSRGGSFGGVGGFAVEGLGFISSFITIISFAAEVFAPPEPASSVIKIGVGLDGTTFGGDLPDIRLFNNLGEFIGISSDPGHIGDGGTAEIKVSHSGDNSQQAAYTLFSANDNAICISMASITWPDGSQFAWVGDWAQKCNLDWYYSGTFVPGVSYSEGNTPACLWIDKNGDRETTGFQLHWPSFAPTRKPGTLCESDTSRGPDFANYAEGLFCRMSDKTLLSFCRRGGRTNKQCFDQELRQVVTGDVTALNVSLHKTITTNSANQPHHGPANRPQPGT